MKYSPTIQSVNKTLLQIPTHPEGKYALHIACAENQIELVDHFLKNVDIDPAQTDINGNNALHYAGLASVKMMETVIAAMKHKCG